MPRACSICTHPDRLAIKVALRGGTPLRTIAARWSVSKTALLRHRDAHLHPAPATPQAAEPPGALTQASIEVPQLAEAHTTPVVVDAGTQALAVYAQALAAYETLREADHLRRLPLYTGLLAVRWHQVEIAYERCLACGVDPARR